MNLRIVTIRRNFLALHRINEDSAGNYHLMEEESIGGMVIPPGITSSQTRNPPKERDSAGNRSLFSLIPTAKIKMRGKFSER
jgi:hypothetical protein